MMAILSSVGSAAISTAVGSCTGTGAAGAAQALKTSDASKSKPRNNLIFLLIFISPQTNIVLGLI
jgi:hypothetical protein